MDNIKRLGELAILQGKLGAKKTSTVESLKGGEEFDKVLKKSMQDVSNLQSKEDKSIEELGKGKIKDVPQTILTLKKAGTSLKLHMQTLSKIQEAYQKFDKGS